jgi:hypothetical protein
LALLRRRLGFDPPAGPFAGTAAVYFKEGPIMDIVKVGSTARTLTGSASRYLQQTCKHWAHNLTVEFTPEHGTIVFPRDARGADHPGDALVTFDADGEALTTRIEATSPAQLDGLKGAVARHVDRFAFREAPLPFDWQDD